LHELLCQITDEVFKLIKVDFLEFVVVDLVDFLLGLFDMVPQLANAIELSVDSFYDLFATAGLAVVIESVS